ncbi:MAG: hypothetical protein U5N56_12775 [Candidatus Marinimicrobia bacterium]|nr:hypothetical protein [Candidatus Neomarinimicrobiota bacterium]
MEKRHHIHIYFFLFLLIAASALTGQLFRQEWKIGPEYKIDHVVKPGDEKGKGELQVSLSIPYDEILFAKSNSEYNGRFDISIMIFKDDKTGRERELGREHLSR